jgi:spore germination cell wall hydrolase CwlJ-like protein
VSVKPREVDAKTELYLIDSSTDKEVPLNNEYPTAGVTAHIGIVLDHALNDEPPTVEQEDIELLARLITAEQGYSANYDDEEEYEELAYLTGSVVINRINSEKFPNTLREVIEQPGQYQCYSNGHIDRPFDDIAYEIAEELLVFGTTIDEGIVFQSEFQQGSGVYRQIGNTYFCYE